MENELGNCIKLLEMRSKIRTGDSKPPIWRVFGNNTNAVQGLQSLCLANVFKTT